MTISACDRTWWSTDGDGKREFHTCSQPDNHDGACVCSCGAAN